VTTQRHVLETVKRLCERRSVAAVYVSHDLAVVSNLATRVAVMRSGRLVETGTVSAIFGHPQHAYTWALLAAIPDTRSASVSNTEALAAQAPILTLEGVTARHGSKVVFRELSLTLPEKSCLALVGESGSGKTALARCMTGLHVYADGSMRFRDRILPFNARLRPNEVRRQIRYVFQNPYSSLNPKRTVAGSITAALRHFESLSARTVASRTRDVLDQVALPAAYADRLPHQFSGGQHQRAAIARALILKPDLLVCDEITSALDVLVQAVVIDLLKSLQRSHGLTILFVTHNLALAAAFARDVIVMHGGRIVERRRKGGVLVAAPPRDPSADRRHTTSALNGEFL
jgi:peptide/nickel transport system ATP-binding protein